MPWQFDKWMNGGGDAVPQTPQEALRQGEIDRIMKVLKPDGSWVGTRGKTDEIRVLFSGEDGAGQFIKELTKNGAYPMKETFDKKTGEPNGFTWALPNDYGEVTYRKVSKSGPPTISINLNNERKEIKLKFLDRP